MSERTRRYAAAWLGELPIGYPVPKNVDGSAWDTIASAIGEALLRERAQLPPVVLGQCEHHTIPDAAIGRCRSLGITLPGGDRPGDRFLCPAHGADLACAGRRGRR